MVLFVSYVKVNRAYENVFDSVATDFFGDKESGTALTVKEIQELEEHILTKLEPNARRVTILNWKEINH